MLRRSVAVAAIAGAVLSCGGTSSRRPVRSLEDIGREYRARAEALYARAFREMVWIDCSAPKRPPEAECGLLADEILTDAAIARFVVDVCHEEPSEGVSDECASVFHKDFVGRVATRYPRATIDAIRAQCRAHRADCNQFTLLELAAMAAHNDAVMRRLEAESEALLDEHREALLRRGEQMEAENRAREKEAEVWRGVAAALSGAAAGMRSGLSAPSAYEPPAATANARTCSSDLQCGLGNVCVKGELRMTGICARAVDQHGIQTYPTPRGNFGPGGRGQCSFDTQCPIGFRCHKDGALTGNCVK